MAFIVVVLTGCPEAQNMMKPVVDEPADTKPPAMVGDMKKPEEPETTEQEETPVEEPADTTPPTVVAVAWYGDEQITEALTTDSEVHSGDTIYTVVTFSEPMMHIVANNEAVRPVLYIVVDGKTKRYKMLPHEANLKSGEVKPTNGDTDEYLCKYTIPADTIGTLALRVGSASADTAGNRVAEASEYTAPFTIEPKLIAISLPGGYTLPPELIPTEPTVLSEAERVVMEMHDVRGYDPLALQPCNTGSNADLISLVPFKDREEVYDLFVKQVDLPHFAEAAAKTKKIDMTLAAIDVSNGWDAYLTYLHQATQEQGYSGQKQLNLLRDIYLEENPEHKKCAATFSHSKYWIILEYYRLQLEHPDLPTLLDTRRGHLAKEILALFRESCKKGRVFGLDNPWS